MIIRDAIAWGSAKLKNAGIESPSLDAALLLCSVMNIDRSTLIAKDTETLSDEALAAYQTLIERRKKGECVAYITGKKEFYGLEFFVNKSVLVPRADTEILVETAIDILKKGTRDGGQGTGENCKIKVLDLCTGSGAIAVSLKHEMPEIEIHATDISAEALEVAKGNAKRLLGENKILFYLGDLYDAIPRPPSPVPCPPHAHYSLITVNPPYISTNEINTLPPEVQHEPRLALDGGKTGLEIIERIIEKAPEYLVPGGVLLMEADPRQMKTIAALLEKRGFCDIQLNKDLAGQERVIGGRFEV
jgi:release factor glutamine methyltransferase